MTADEDVEREERQLLAAARNDWTEEHEIMTAEMAKATRRMTRKKTAPGPDGIHRTVMGAIMPEVGPAIRGAFNACLRDGTFSGTWKEANLVLIPKPGSIGRSACWGKPGNY